VLWTRKTECFVKEEAAIVLEVTHWIRTTDSVVGLGPRCPVKDSNTRDAFCGTKPRGHIVKTNNVLPS
jgi:hypothetical protein